MAKYGSSNVAFLLVDGYSIMGVQTELEDEYEASSEPDTGLGDNWEKEGSTGTKQAHLRQRGFFDTGTNLAHEALVGSIGTARIMCFGFATNVIGQSFIGVQGGLETKYARRATVAKLTRADAEYIMSGGPEEGKILAHLTARTAAGNTEATSVDNGAASVDGGSGYLEVSALTLGGYTNLIVNIRHSVDNIAWATKGTFTAVVASPVAERLAIAGTINRYAAISWTWTGAGAGQTATFMVGLYRA